MSTRLRVTAGAMLVLASGLGAGAPPGREGGHSEGRTHWTARDEEGQRADGFEGAGLLAGSIIGIRDALKPGHSHDSASASEGAARHAPAGSSRIVGVVVGADGKPVAGARVMLRSSSGHEFFFSSSKHATRTSSTGSFVMTGVEPGRYQVVASTKSKRAGGREEHVRTVIGPDDASEVKIRM